MYYPYELGRFTTHFHNISVYYHYLLNVKKHPFCPPKCPPKLRTFVPLNSPPKCPPNHKTSLFKPSRTRW
nr:MAG TPA: hypothetical protein [Caudoviricetes sp.]